MVAIKRRRFLLAAGASLAGVGTAQSQLRSKVARIGFLSLDAKSTSLDTTFAQALQQLGWVEGKNLDIEYRWAAGDMQRLTLLANELSGLKLDLIVARSTPVVHSLKDAAKTVPILMTSVSDPVGSGFVASLARPGGNITGVSLMAPGLGGKRLELLREVVPRLSQVSFLAHGGDPVHKLFLLELQEAGPKLGLKIHTVFIKGVEEIDSAFSTIVDARSSGLVIQPLIVTFLGQAARIAKLAISSRLPTISDGLQFADAGGLMHYGADRLALEKRLAALVDKILKGAKPADLPVEQPTTFELVINMRTAKALGLTIPQTVLVRADRIVE